MRPGRLGNWLVAGNPAGRVVGASRFERPTSRTPSECATGLRYAPTNSFFSVSDSEALLINYFHSHDGLPPPSRALNNPNSLLAYFVPIGIENPQNTFQFGPNLVEAVGGEGRLCRVSPSPPIPLQSHNGIAFLVKHPFYF